MEILIGSTRFNNDTLKENEYYKTNYHVDGIVYGTPLKINEKYVHNSIVFIIEMNNDTNKIHGVGLIRNCLNYELRHCVYTNHNWNRFLYAGKYWVNREQVEQKNKHLLEQIENSLFKGKSHMKRVSGISVFTPKNYTKWNLNKLEIKTMFKELFMEYFCEKNKI